MPELEGYVAGEQRCRTAEMVAGTEDRLGIPKVQVSGMASMPAGVNILGAVNIERRIVAQQSLVLTHTVDNDDTLGVLLAGRPNLGLIVPVCNNTPTITPQVSLDNTNWFDLFDGDGTASIVIVGGATAFALSALELAPLAGYVGIYLRFHFSVAQTATRTFILLTVA
jgi:hypothetical protein